MAPTLTCCGETGNASGKLQTDAVVDRSVVAGRPGQGVRQGVG
jgi:hypothetical protein